MRSGHTYSVFMASLVKGVDIMSKFRVGDVVRTSNNVEMRVRQVNALGWLNMEGETGAYFPAHLTLLRRPVMVGDVLRDTRTGEAFVVGRVSGDNMTDSAGRCCLTLNGAVYTHWTHADGTPIEAPRAAPSVRKVTGLDLQRFDIPDIDDAALLDDINRASRASSPYTLPALTYALWCTDPDVVAHVHHVSEWDADASCCAETFIAACDRCDAQEARYRRAPGRGWARACFGYQPERNWAERAAERAAAVLGVLADG